MVTTMLDRSRPSSAAPSDGSRADGNALLAATRAAVAAIGGTLAPRLPDMTEAGDAELVRFAGQEPVYERIERTRLALLWRGGGPPR